MFRFSTGILGSDHVNDDVLRRRFARARLQTKRVFQANLPPGAPGPLQVASVDRLRPIDAP